MSTDRPPPAADSFACEIVREHHTATLRAVGSLDIATAPILETQVAELRKAGVRRVILDLTRLYFIDSTGLRCILECDAQARQDGFAIGLIQGPRAVQRVFDLTGTTAQLPFIDR
jgi:anti-sigma B factor antagonist